MKKLSAYVREGAALRPQAFDDYIVFVNMEPYTCAIGAAYEAITGTLPPATVRDRTGKINAMITMATGVTGDMLLPFPDSEIPGGIFNVIAYCNDDLHWTREAIANYLERYNF